MCTNRAFGIPRGALVDSSAGTVCPERYFLWLQAWLGGIKWSPWDGDIWAAFQVTGVCGFAHQDGLPLSPCLPATSEPGWPCSMIGGTDRQAGAGVAQEGPRAQVAEWGSRGDVVKGYYIMS